LSIELNQDQLSQAFILEIKSKRTRNLVRGILSAKDESALKGTMERLRREISPDDATVVFRILRDSPLAEGLLQPHAFPQTIADVSRLPDFTAGPLQVEIAVQSERLQRESARLVEAIALVASINERIIAGDSDGVNFLFLKSTAEFGVSLIVAAKAISFRHMANGSGDKRKSHSDFLAPFTAPRRQVVVGSFEDSVDLDREYLQVRRSFLRFAATNRLNPSDAAIVVDNFSVLDLSRYDLAQRLQAFGRWGVLDTTAYLFRIRAIFLALGRSEDAALVDANLPTSVADAWEAAFDTIDVQALQTLIGDKDQFFERAFFAHMPAWSEYKTLLGYRLKVEEAIGTRLDGRFSVTKPDASRFADPCSTVDELLSRGPPAASLDRVLPQSSGAFHRTIALIASIETDTLAPMSGEQLNSLLDQTVDVAGMFSKAEIARFLPRKPSDALYEFLRTAVVNDAEEKEVSNHALRRALQTLVQQRFGSDIVQLLNYVDSERGHVSAHLYNLCSEAFLSELYDIYVEAEDVIEAQASILEWRGTTKNDKDATNRAKSHRLNLRLRKVRGAIDETRIYVDPLRFLQWMHDQYGGELRSLAPLAEEILADPDRSVNLNDAVRVAVQPRLRLLGLLDACYEEFCTNKIYGVTSFIGRRIRHGTLHGHLVLEFQPEVQSAIIEFDGRAPQFARFLENWLTQFDAAVKVMAADNIHVRSKERPKGLIIAKLDEAEKSTIASVMLEAIAISMKDRFQLSVTLGLVQEFCWLLFEVDLKRTRDAVAALRREFVIKVDQPQFADRPELARRVNEKIRAINSSLQLRFEQVGSWLTRPTNLSPSASVTLLFEAVLDEVRQRYPNFQPQLNITGKRDIDLLGHRFHFFYDALYILVDNAAKHGKPNGVLGVEIDSWNPDNKHIQVRVSVRSDFEDPSNACARIDDAMDAEVGDAMVSNYKSGIRKLRSLVEDVEEIVGFERNYDDASVVFTIDMRYVRSA
jgi:hypothetical protein